MNFKEFKKKVKTEEYKIPDVKEKIKESTIFKNREIEDEVSVNIIRNKNWLRISLSAVILVLIAVLTIVFVVPGKNSDKVTYESSPISYLKSTEELEEMVGYYHDTTTFGDKLINFISGITTSQSVDNTRVEDSSIIFSTSNVDYFTEYSMADVQPQYKSSIFSSNAVALYSTVTSYEVSKTNVQVENVDEADVVKSDGKSIYRAYEKKVLINDIDNGNISDTKELELTNDNYYVDSQELYLTDKYLVVLFFSYEKSVRKNWYLVGYSNRFINLHVYDKATLELKKQYKADYVTFNESRLVNGETDVFYLVFNQSVYKNNAYREPEYLEDGTDKNVEITDVCYFDGFRKYNYTYILSIKLDDTLELNKNVTLGPSSWDGIYMTETSMYLYDTYYEEEIKGYLSETFYSWKTMASIVKYSINNGEVVAQASLSTEGTIISQFAIDEYDGYLRLVTSEENNNKLEIYKLAQTEDGFGFGLVGSITKGLGEKNEEVKSVNFNKTTCIVVTAKQTDPMYNIDLSDPTNPKIVGKFKENGYNSYLQYLTGDLEGLAIGIGYITHDISEKYNVRDWTKFGLYKVEDGKDPVQLELIEYSTKYIEACDNHKALFIYKNYIGFEADGFYKLYEVVKTEDSYKLEERINYDFVKNDDYYSTNVSRMYFVNGYFYLSFIDPYCHYETGIISFDSNYQEQKAVVHANS